MKVVFDEWGVGGEDYMQTLKADRKEFIFHTNFCNNLLYNLKISATLSRINTTIANVSPIEFQDQWTP